MGGVLPMRRVLDRQNAANFEVNEAMPKTRVERLAAHFWGLYAACTMSFSLTYLRL